MHTVEELAAATLPKRPREQAVHAEAPISSALYEPAKQAVHTPDVLAAAASAYLPVAHAVHAAEELAATTLPKRPAEQAVHTRVFVASEL